MNIRFKLPLVAAAVFILFSHCEDKTIKRDYPLLNDLEVINITSSGATFTAEVSDAGNYPITEHGFVWGENKNLTESYSDRVYLGSFSGTGNFQSDILTTLVAGKQYYVSAFLKAGDYLVYSKPVLFLSLGSQAPVVTGFSPKSAQWGDTISISGKNFSNRLGSNIVSFGSVNVYVLTSYCDTLIKCTIPSYITAKKSTVSVSGVGNMSTIVGDSLTFIYPEVTDFYPKSGRWGDTIFIKGKLLAKYLSQSNTSGIFFNDLKSVIFSKYYDTLIKTVVPLTLTDNPTSLALKMNSLSYKTENTFSLLSPYIDSISPDTTSWGSILTLYGRFNPLSSMNQVTIGGIAAAISGVTSKTITVYVPTNLSTYTNSVVLKSANFTVSSPEMLYLYKPVIKYFTPVSGLSGTLVKIVGKHFKPEATTVFFGTTKSTIKSVSDSVIYCYVPGLTSHSSIIKVTSLNTECESRSSFNITNPYITNISPINVSYGDNVTITGKYFRSATNWGLGGMGASTVVISDSLATMKIGESMGYSPTKVSVVLTNNYETSISESSQYLYLNDFTFNSVAPVTGRSGDMLTLTGTNLNPNKFYLKVTIGGLEADITSSSSTGATITVPNLPAGEYAVVLTSAERSHEFPQKYSNDSPWQRLNDLPFLYDYGCAFDFGEDVYVATAGTSSTSRYIYVFDINSKSFNKLPGIFNSDIVDPFSCTLNGKGYIIGQRSTVSVGFELFNPDSLIWRKLPDFPGPKESIPFIVAADSVILAGCGRPYNTINYGDLRDLWKYSPKTNRWTRLADAPSFFCCFPPNQYYKDGILYSTGSFYTWEYSMASDSWTRTSGALMGDYGGTVSVELNGKWYLGGGNRDWAHTDGTNLLDFDNAQFYVYRTDTKKWSDLNYEPYIPHTLSMYFTVGGYLFIGGSQRAHTYDFWMYDPSKE
jgi:hypothetical protein